MIKYNKSGSPVEFCISVLSLSLSLWLCTLVLLINDLICRYVFEGESGPSIPDSQVPT